MKNMSKQLRDYLHLYLGCECWVQGQAEAHPLKLTGISYDDQVGEIWCYFENTETGYALLGDVKPILRLLSDMTEDEAEQFIRIDSNLWHDITEIKIDSHKINFFSTYKGGNKRRFKQTIRFDQQSTYMILFLLSKHFDLFGLIAAGLAIDKTKVAVI